MKRQRVVTLASVFIGIVGLISIWVSYAHGVPTVYVSTPITVILLTLAGVNWHLWRAERRRGT